MRRGIPGRRSRAAGWARVAGGLALPVLVLGVAGARAGIVPEMAVPGVLGAGFALGVLALALAGYSLVDIWNSGADGVWIAVTGIIYAAPAIGVLALVAAAATVYPRLNDVTTDPDDPPDFVMSDVQHGLPGPGAAAIQRAAYPQIVSHVYPQPLGDVYEAVRDLLREKGWKVTRDLHPPTMAVAEETSLLQVATPGRAPEAAPAAEGEADKAPEEETAAEGPGLPEVAPVQPALGPPLDEAWIEARASTLIFGFQDDVAVRLRSGPDGTEVDMRSASRFGEHDLGANARRISRFFSALDEKLQPDPGATASR